MMQLLCKEGYSK